MKDWTIMVYLAADNNLSEEGVWNLKELYRAGAGLDKRRVDVVVQIDPIARDIRRYEVTTDLGIRREELMATKQFDKRGAPVSPITNEIEDGKLFSIGQPVRGSRDSMATPRTLGRFIRESKLAHPADRYMLILSGHGGGSIGDSFLMDGFPPSALSMRDLRRTIGRVGQIDVLGMDSCGMAMAEVAYQLPDNVQCLVAAEGFELNTGWPYHKVLAALNANANAETSEIAARIVYDHTKYYSDYILAGVSTDLAAYDLRRKGDLAKAVKILTEAMGQNLKKRSSFKQPGYYVEDRKLAERSIADAVILSHWRVQSYRFEEHADLYDFCDLLEKGCAEMKDEAGDQASIREACNQVKSVIRGNNFKTFEMDGNALEMSADGFVIKSCHSGGAFQHSHGVSIYFPWTEFFDEYKALRFAQKTGWGDFVKAFIQRTRRRPRPGVGEPHPVPQADNSATIVKDNPLMGTKDNPLMGTKGQVITPKVKNPPDIFYDDNC